MAQWVKNLPAVQKAPEMWVRLLGREDPLEEGPATHSSLLAWRTPWTEEPGGYSPWGRAESDTTERLSPWDRAESDTTERLSAAPSPPLTQWAVEHALE